MDFMFKCGLKSTDLRYRAVNITEKLYLTLEISFIKLEIMHRKICLPFTVRRHIVVTSGLFMSENLGKEDVGRVPALKFQVERPFNCTFPCRRSFFSEFRVQ